MAGVAATLETVVSPGSVAGPNRPEPSASSPKSYMESIVKGEELKALLDDYAPLLKKYEANPKVTKFKNEYDNLRKQEADAAKLLPVVKSRLEELADSVTRSPAYRLSIRDNQYDTPEEQAQERASRAERYLRSQEIRSYNTSRGIYLNLGEGEADFRLVSQAVGNPKSLVEASRRLMNSLVDRKNNPLPNFTAEHAAALEKGITAVLAIPEVENDPAAKSVLLDAKGTFVQYQLDDRKKD